MSGHTQTDTGNGNIRGQKLALDKIVASKEQLWIPQKFNDFIAPILCKWGYTAISRVSCQKGPTRHAYAWPIGPFWQDTLNIWSIPRNMFAIHWNKLILPLSARVNSKALRQSYTCLGALGNVGKWISWFPNKLQSKTKPKSNQTMCTYYVILGYVHRSMIKL